MRNPDTLQLTDALYALIAEYFPDNTVGRILPADARLVLASMADAIQAANARLDGLTTNQVKGALFRVPYVELVGGVLTVPMSLIPARFRILGMDVRAVNGTDAASAAAGVKADPIDFRLLAFSGGTIDALVDEQASTVATVRARFVRTSGTTEQKQASFTELPLEDAPLTAGDVYKYTDATAGTVRLYEIDHSLNLSQNPLPTGLDTDRYYKSYAPPPAAPGATGVSQAYVDDANAAQQEEIAGLADRVQTVEAGAEALTTDAIKEGETNLYFTAARAVGAVLTGYVKATASRAIAATDSVRTALGLLERRLDEAAVAPLRVALINGTTVKLDVDGVYPTIDSGTFLVDVNGRVKGKTAIVKIGINGSAPDLSDAALVKASSSGAHKAGKVNTYGFVVDGDGLISYIIKN